MRIGLPLFPVTAPGSRTAMRAGGRGAEPDGRPAAARSGAAAPVGRVSLPHVVAWNLTRRCNLACAHCYISAGSWHAASEELTVAECRRIVDEIMAVHREANAREAGAAGSAAAPAPMLILSGGEPLLREDLEEIAAHATGGGATVVVGTNGTRLTEERVASLQAAGVTGVALSIDSLEARYHDRFRHGQGALQDTLDAVTRLRERRLDFVVQTTLTRGNRHELERLVAWAAQAGAVSFNLYFLVETGRGAGMRGLRPEENDAALRDLVRLQREYRGRMLVRSKCQPQIMRHVHEADPESPLLHYETRCPCGIQYCRITPEGRVTPCPYLPEVAGDLRTQRFGDIWWGSPLFRRLRTGELGGKCGRCEYRGLCGGCRARAFATTGDVLAADESCAYEPPGDRPVIGRQREVTYGASAPATLEWSPEALDRLRRIPSFVRGVVTHRVEKYARENGHARITPELMNEIRSHMPIDFSKVRPFFMRGEE